MHFRITCEDKKTPTKTLYLPLSRVPGFYTPVLRTYAPGQGKRIIIKDLTGMFYAKYICAHFSLIMESVYIAC